MLMDQSQFMRKFNETHREDFSPELFKRDNQDIIDSIYEVVKSCERDKYFTLKVLNFTVIDDYEEIYNTLRDHVEKRRKKNDKSFNPYNFINIKDTDMILIKIEWLVRHNGIERQEINNKTIEVTNPEQILEVLVAVPRFTKGYYFRLAGNYYTTTFQIVDGSTYNNSTASQSKVDTVTMKTMFSPLRMFRGFVEMTDINSKSTLKVIEYNCIIFNNSVNAMYYLLAHFGWYGICQFLDIDCVSITKYPVNTEGYLCFKKLDFYISCPSFCFEDPMVQSLVATIYRGINKDTTYENLFDIRYWLTILGAAFKNASIDKGLFVLDSVDGIYDRITKRDLHLSEENKANIYTIIRWIMREFSNLRTKENVDVRTKRIRLADYIGATYATKLNKGLYRIADLGRRVTLAKVIQAVYTHPLHIINSISTMSNLVAYRDMVNDNDASVALKYTYKGISGLGEDGASVQPIYRYVDPSHVGILDLDASSSSDPGMSGMICPMTHLYGDHSFSEYQEPDTWNQTWEPIKTQYHSNLEHPISFDREPEKVDYYKLREQIIQEDLELNKIICPIYNKDDPTILYTCSAQQIEKIIEAKPKSLFNLTEDSEEFNLSEDDE